MVVKANFLKRLTREIEEINENSSTHRIYAHVDNPETLDGLKILLIGPNDSPYYGGFFLFSVVIPDQYPFIPPVVNFLTPNRFPKCRVHPNLYANGKVCLSILNTWEDREWVPVYSLEKLFLTIQGLMDDNPIAHEPSQEHIKKTNPMARDYTLIALQRVLSVCVSKIWDHPNLPPPFLEIIKKFYRDEGGLYLKQVEQLKEYEGKTLKCMHGEEVIIYEQLKKDLSDMLLEHF